jgi:hypothetical protein
MNTDHSIPPLRDLPSGRLAERKQHLLAELTREQKARFSLPTFSFPRLRFVALASAGVCIAAATALLLTLSGGSGQPHSPFILQAIHGPAWTAHVSHGSIDLGGGTTNFNDNGDCTSTVQVLFGCSDTLARPSPASPQPTTTAPAAPATAAATAIDGGTPARQALLRSIIDEMQPTTIDEIHIVGTGKKIALRMAATHSLRTIWEESLVAAALRDRMNAAGSKVTVGLVNGDGGGVIPPGPAAPLPAAKAGDIEAARERFKDAAAKIGVPLEELSIYQPDGVAVAATFTSSDPAAFLVHQMPTFLAALGDRWRDYDGTYIGLVDASGTTVWETSSTGRISSGAVGSRQDLSGCSPVVNWGRTPPPCPVK